MVQGTKSLTNPADPFTSAILYPFELTRNSLYAVHNVVDCQGDSILEFDLFIALERMILAVNIFFVEVSFFYADVETAPQVVVPIVLAVAACEAAVGLGLLVVAYRVKGTI